MIRTRFAPSPTGFLHVGGTRTALFAYLVATQADGDFVLRIEDTDQKRLIEESIEHIQNSLRWLGISWNDGPYIQSERLELYKTWANKLIEQGRAYADPYTNEQVQAFREQAQAAKRPFLYRNHRPAEPPKWDGSTALRFKADPKAYQWNDEVMGDLTSKPEVIDDFIIMKSDGYPTYNFAHIIDDTDMKITHVIRGQEFLSSMPNYLNLYEALELERPIFATMPHIMNEQGNKKLSKRDGAKDVLDYGKTGYLPETLLSFIATLGWNDGTEQEVFTHAELIEKFSLARVQKSGARFDEKRLLWMNGQFIRNLSLDDLYSRCDGFWPDSAEQASEADKKTILALVQDRLKTLTDLPTISDYFFADPTPNWQMTTDSKQLKKCTRQELVHLLDQTITALEATDFTAESLQDALNQLLETTGQKPGTLFSMIRLAVSWAPFSPPLHETLAVLGKETSLARLHKSIEMSTNS